MPIETFPLGPLETNCYLIHDATSAVVVDPGGDPQKVVDFLQEHKLRLQAIALTHMHFDHIYGVAALHKATNAPVLSPPGDAHLMDTGVGGGGVWGFPRVETFSSSPLQAGEVQWGDMHCTVLDTPGHTPGSVSLYFKDEQALFSGDVLFYRSIGRTDFEGGNLDTLLHSVREQIFTLPGETIVYPGHGLSTNVNDEKTSNPYCGAFVR